MDTLKYGKPLRAELQSPEIWLLFGLLLMLWMAGPHVLHGMDQTSGTVDQSIWLLIVLSFIVFIMVVSLSWWLLNRFWLSIGLPGINSLVLTFKSLESWQQLMFFLASFALVLLAALGSLIAIC